MKTAAYARLTKDIQSLHYLTVEYLLAVKFRSQHDKSNKKPKLVYLLTTSHANAIAACSKKDKDGNAIMKPARVLDYNRCMGGVDLVDQQLDSLLVIRKTYKLYKKVVFRVLLQCMLSTHKLMQREGGKQDFLKFTHDVVTQMLSVSPRLHRTMSDSGLNSIARLTGRNHFRPKERMRGLVVIALRTLQSVVSVLLMVVIIHLLMCVIIVIIAT